MKIQFGSTVEQHRSSEAEKGRIAKNDLYIVITKINGRSAESIRGLFVLQEKHGLTWEERNSYL